MDALIPFHPASIVNPDDCEVLHIVKDLKECYPDKDVLDAVIAIPPKRNAADQQSHLDRACSSVGAPITPVTPQEGKRDQCHHAYHAEAHASHYRRWNGRSTTLVVEVKETPKSHGRKQN